jgi:hypothetical protein
MIGSSFEVDHACVSANLASGISTVSSKRLLAFLPKKANKELCQEIVFDSSVWKKA